MAKLRPDGMSVLDIGCGTGVLGLPVAERATRYVGVDLSSKALSVLHARLPGSVLLNADVTKDDLSTLGTFDRVLVYAALHYVASEAEGELFVRTALERLAPGGRALFGNLPMPDADLPHTPWQRLGGVGWSVRRRLGHRPRREATTSMPAGYCIPLNRGLIEQWLRGVPQVRWRWVAPRVGVPMQRTRADLIVEKSLAPRPSASAISHELR